LHVIYPVEKGPASEVYLHEMPGGQFPNLKEQARSLGLESRWHQVAQTYADVNQMFGDIVKVTPSSKVVGDMALLMVSQDLTVADVINPAKDVSFPESVVPAPSWSRPTSMPSARRSRRRSSARSVISSLPRT
jgi:pyruvate carboxylase